MKDDLAELLLAKVMDWTPENIASERPVVQAMAAYKYDEYGQFSPGMRFVESLALWLNQFSKEERQVAYEFVKKRLIFYSAAEMAHLVSITYPDFIRPILFERAAKLLSIPERQINRITASTEFKVLQRQSLFLGLSDGSHTDIFRRSNPELSNEQIWQTYEISSEKAEDMLQELSKDLKQIRGCEPEQECRFQMIFLLDDFSASGISYLRQEEDGSLKGKIAKFYERLKEPNNKISALVSLDNLYICIVLYMATEQARSYLTAMTEKLFKQKGGINHSIKVIQPLSKQVPLQEPGDLQILDLVKLNQYYDPSVETKATEKGGTNDVKKGFAGCALPVVLSHNTPNNSVFLLWADPELYKVRGLFPRVSRHRS